MVVQRRARIELTKKRAKWYYRFMNPNGRISWHSEQYGRKQDAKIAARTYYAKYCNQRTVILEVQ